MRYIQFYHLSTGYPTFLEEDRKPIPACGSDAVCILDGRYNLNTCINVANDVFKKKKGYIGFTIVRATDFLDRNEKVLYKSF